MRRMPWLPCLLLALLGLPAAEAKKVYKVVDADGVTRYSDRAPAGEAQASTLPVRVEQQRTVHLRLEGSPAGQRVLVRNLLPGPVEVEVRFRSRQNVAAAPALPARAVIPASSERAVATITVVDPYQAAGFELEYEGLPGDPGARPDDSEYQLPLAGRGWRLAQGYGGAFSHTAPEARYAIDLGADEGTTVLAARAGVVMELEVDFEGAGLSIEKYGARANHIRILHDDGSMAVYAHLQPESALVRLGQRVRAGQAIAASGNTGYSTGPHLHFAVQVNRDHALHSIPFRLRGPDGPLALPDAGRP